MLRRSQTLLDAFRASGIAERCSWNVLTCSVRQYSTPVESELKSKFAADLPREQERLKAIKKEHGTKELHAVTVNMAIGGMRGITGMLYETSLLDPEEGIQFRGHSIPELKVRFQLFRDNPGPQPPLPWAVTRGALSVYRIGTRRQARRICPFFCLTPACKEHRSAQKLPSVSNQHGLAC